jgi:Domain of unknown function (DUF4260)
MDDHPLPISPRRHEMAAMTMDTKATTDDSSTVSTMDRADQVAWIRPWLRLEGLAVFGAGLVGFLALGVPWYAFPLLLLVPDVSAVGYLRGPRVGALVYNVAHDLFTGAAIVGIGLATGLVPVTAAGAILVAHSGMDRAAGYGLKLPTSFQDTHLGRIGKRKAA